MKIAALISGGKDSIYAAYKASKEHEIVCLISFKSKKADSYMFHIPNIDLVKQQAKVMELPLIFMESSGIKEKELNDIKKALKIAIKKYKIEGVVSGALASNYQKERIDKILKLYVDGNSMLNIIEKGFEKEKVEKIFARIKANKHKLEMPTTIKV